MPSLTCTCSHQILERTGIGVFEVNSVAYDSPSAPVLLQSLQVSGAQKTSDLLPIGSVYGLDANKSVELTVPGDSAGGPVSYPRIAVPIS